MSSVKRWREQVTDYAFKAWVKAPIGSSREKFWRGVWFTMGWEATSWDG